MKTLKLTDGQYKLLISLLKEAIENRSSCGCNDVFEEELKIFTIAEIKDAITTSYGKKYLKNLEKELVGEEGSIFDEELKCGFGCFDTTFAESLLIKIKKQK